MTLPELATLIEQAIQDRGALMRDHSAHVGSQHAAILAVLKQHIKEGKVKSGHSRRD